MKVGVGFDDLSMLVEEAASCIDGSIEIVDCRKVGVGERFVDEGPEALGGLEFRTARRLIDEPDAVGNGEVFRAMPTCIVELEHDDAITPGAGLVREGLEQLGKEGLVDAVRQIPDGLPARWRDEAGDVEPFVAVMTERDRPLADRRPNPATDRFQAEPMFIRAPDFDRLVRMLGDFFGHRVGELF
jgi:hypothetical protein